MRALTIIGAMVGVLPLVFSDADWRPFNSALGGSRAMRVGRGLALAVPPVILFSALFAAADPIFGAFYSRLFQFDMETLLEHCVIIGFVAWAVAGFLRDMVIPGRDRERAAVINPGRMAFTESMVVLGSVTLVFLLFVVIQVRALFGGEKLEPFTRQTIVSLPELAENCRKIRTRGYATDDGEFIDGVRCIAAPIRNRQGTVIASIGISAPKSRFPTQKDAEYAARVTECAREIGKLVGGEDAESDN